MKVKIGSYAWTVAKSVNKYIRMRQAVNSKRLSRIPNQKLRGTPYHKDLVELVIFFDMIVDVCDSFIGRY